jgi:hypothetical protein
VTLGAICLTATACGATEPVRRTPTKQDVATIAQTLSDIVYQCQSVAAGFVAGADPAAIKGDVDALLRTYRRVRPDARLTIGPLHTTPRKELALAQANLQMAGCAPAEGREVLATEGH